MSARSASTIDPTRIQILVQYRSKRGKVFELTNGASVLTVEISQRRSTEDCGDWRVETRTGTGVLGPAVTDEWGNTAAEAFGKAASSWMSRQPALERFNWEAIATELHAVQAV
jgi:hypothetical protein